MKKMLEISGLNIELKDKTLIKDGYFYVKANNKDEKGEIVLIQGPNGSGKSSILKTLLNKTMFNKKESIYWKKESYFFNEKPIINLEDYDNFKQNIGYVEQSDDTWTARTPYELFIQSYQFHSKDARKEEIIQKAQQLLSHFGMDFSILQKKLNNKNLSGGEKRIINIISALVRDVDLYIIDEPINNLDTYKSMKLKMLLEDYIDQGKNIILITHCRLFLPKIDRSYVLCNETIVENKHPVNACQLSEDGILDCNDH